MDLPTELAAAVINDIEEMGNDAPVSFKRLWGYLMAYVCNECKLYGIMLCSEHSHAARQLDV